MNAIPVVIKSASFIIVKITVLKNMKNSYSSATATQKTQPLYTMSLELALDAYCAIIFI